jgi:hypothetical protein
MISATSDPSSVSKPIALVAPVQFTSHSQFSATLKPSQNALEVLMIPLSFAVPGELIWSKIPHQSGFELKQGGGVVARLDKPSFWSCRMRAEAQGGRWAFSRTGFWRNTTVAVDEDSKAAIARLTRSWSGIGTLTFSDGQTFRLSPTGFWRMIWVVKSAMWSSGDAHPFTNEESGIAVRARRLREPSYAAGAARVAVY